MKQINVDGVLMSAGRRIRLRHVSDEAGDMNELFGGDTMGHWNVGRINRLLDAFKAPVVHMPVPPDVMLGMAKVGAPDVERAKRHAVKGVATMPPLSFVAFPTAEGGINCLLVDGHHRLMALCLLMAETIPARVLPPELADDVRVVEMYESVVFPEPEGFSRKYVVQDLAA